MFILRAAGFAAVTWSLFQLGTAGIGFFHVMVQRPLHLGFALIISFLSYPGRRGKAGEVQAVPGRLEFSLALAAAASVAYLVLERQRVIQRIAFVDPVRSADSLVCMLLICLTLEAARRVLGNAVPAVACCFLAYLFLGPFIPGDMLSHSGINLARFDPDGNLIVSGRIQHRINLAGIKVDPVEIENVLRLLPEVRDCCVRGRSHPRQGEVIEVLIVVQPSRSLTRWTVVEHCRQNLAEYKIPRVIRFLGDIPRDLMSKLPDAWRERHEAKPEPPPDEPGRPDRT